VALCNGLVDELRGDIGIARPEVRDQRGGWRELRERIEAAGLRLV